MKTVNNTTKRILEFCYHGEECDSKQILIGKGEYDKAGEGCGLHEECGQAFTSIYFGNFGSGRGLGKCNGDEFSGGV